MISRLPAFLPVRDDSDVGYSTLTVEAAKQIALTVQFEDCAGGEIAIKDIIKSSNATANTAFGTSDQIWRWADNEWKQYYLSKFSDRSKTIDGWVTKESAGKDKVTEDTIPAGETFFFKSMKAQTVTLAGAVKPFTASPSYGVAASQQVFVGYPWPQKLPIAEFNKYCSNPTANTAFGTSDQIWRWGKNSEWDQYYFSKYSDRSKTIDGWVTKASGGKESVTDAEIDVGEGFFFKSMKAQTITFTNAAE